MISDQESTLGFSQTNALLLSYVSRIYAARLLSDRMISYTLFGMLSYLSIMSCRLSILKRLEIITISSSGCRRIQLITRCI